MSTDHPNIKKGFIKHPPKTVDLDLEDKPDLFITEDEIAGNSNYPDWIQIIQQPDQFREKLNPVYAIETIIRHHKNGLYPPGDVLNWLVCSLEEWLSNEGLKTMDTAMGLNKPGNANPLKNVIRDAWERELMIEINTLRLMFNLTIKEAVTMVVTRLDASNEWNKTRFSFPYSETTLAQKYRKYGWSKDFKAMPESIRNHVKYLSIEMKRETLMHYPELAYASFKDKIDEQL